MTGYDFLSVFPASRSKCFINSSLFSKDFFKLHNIFCAYFVFTVFAILHTPPFPPRVSAFRFLYLSFSRLSSVGSSTAPAPCQTRLQEICELSLLYLPPSPSQLFSTTFLLIRETCSIDWRVRPCTNTGTDTGQFNGLADWLWRMHSWIGIWRSYWCIVT